jgi:uncharacterized RDD family membrane protein YckC
MRYAGFWRRLGAFLIDALLLAVAMAALGWLGLPIYQRHVSAVGMEGGSFAASFHVEYNPFGMAIGVLLWWLYFALLESSRLQATLGKLALAIKVITLDGGRIGFWRATLRTIAKYLSAAILMIGFIMAGLTRRKQALHDLVAGTLVVDRPP